MRQHFNNILSSSIISSLLASPLFTLRQVCYLSHCLAGFGSVDFVLFNETK